jgi:hypothetical protein
LAHHYRQGHNKALAFKYELKASAFAVQSGAFHDALKLAESAMHLAELPTELSSLREVIDRAVADLQSVIFPELCHDELVSHVVRSRPNEPNECCREPSHNRTVKRISKSVQDLLSTSRSSRGIDEQTSDIYEEKVHFSVSFLSKANNVNVQSLHAFQLMNSQLAHIQQAVSDGVTVSIAVSTMLSLQVDRLFDEEESSPPPPTSSSSSSLSSSPSPSPSLHSSPQPPRSFLSPAAMAQLERDDTVREISIENSIERLHSQEDVDGASAVRSIAVSADLHLTEIEVGNHIDAVPIYVVDVTTNRCCAIS